MFFEVFIHNIAPIFLLIMLGSLISNKYNLDVYTLSKLNFYVFIPSVIFYNIYSMDFKMELTKAVVFTLVFAFIQLCLSSQVSKYLKLEKAKGNAFKNVVSFYNTGNLGLPLITMIFMGTYYETYAVAAQIMILVTQNLCTFTLGLFNVVNVKLNPKDILAIIIKNPIVYTMLVAFSLRYIPFALNETFVWPALAYARNGMIPVALISLGIQLSKVDLKVFDPVVFLAAFMRLFIGPVIAFLLISIIGIQEILAQVVLISSAVPTAINTALIAVEFKSHPDFTIRAVVVSTIFSIITLPIVIYFARTVLFQ